MAIVFKLVGPPKTQTVIDSNSNINYKQLFEMPISMPVGDPIFIQTAPLIDHCAIP